MWIKAHCCKIQETFSDLFGSYNLNGERRGNDRCTEIALGEQRENDSISYLERWGLGLRPSPLLTQFQLLRVDKCHGLTTRKMHIPEAVQCRCYSALHLPGGQSAKVLLANDTFCSACEQHIQANVHDLAYFCFVSRTYPASHGFLKLSQDWFCLLLSTYVWKIPSKGCHKTHRYFPWLLQES